MLEFLFDKVGRFQACNHINPIQDGPFRGCLKDAGVKKAPHPYNLSRISYNDETWHNYLLPKEDSKKHINHVTHPLSSADISIFSPEISNFCYIKIYKPS